MKLNLLLFKNKFFLSMTSSFFVVNSILKKTSYADSTVFSWGSGQYFQTGFGHNKNTESPKRIRFFDNLEVVDVCSNGHQSFVLTKNGNLYSFGRGKDYRLGHCSDENECSPRIVSNLKEEKVQKISCGEYHTAVITDKNQLWTWGKNYSKQLGRKNDSNKPKVVKTISDVVEVACGKTHTLVVNKKGEVFSCGDGTYGALGHGERKTEDEFKKIDSLNGKFVVKVSAGDDFSLFLTKKGTLYSCGASDFGQTGLGQGQRYFLEPKQVTGFNGKKITKIASNYMHSIATSQKSDLFVWGMNKTGQLGLGDNYNRTLPNQMRLNKNSNEILNVSCGGSHSSVICFDKKTKKNRIFMFGNGRSGQLGRGDFIESTAAYRDYPIEITNSFNGCYPKKISLGNDHCIFFFHALC